MAQSSTQEKPNTRGKKVHIDESLKKYTQAERKEKAEKKRKGEEERKQKERDEREQEADQKRARLLEASRRLAHFQDGQVPTLASRSSLRPDLEIYSQYLAANPPRRSLRNQEETLAQTDGILLSDEGNGDVEETPPPDSKKEKTTRLQPTSASERILLSDEVKPRKQAATQSTKKSTGNASKEVQSATSEINEEQYAAFLQWQQNEAREQQKATKRKEASEKRKADREVERTFIRDAVANNRTTQPTKILEIVSSGRKRALSTADDSLPDTNVKKSKAEPNLGGIRADYRGSPSEKSSDKKKFPQAPAGADVDDGSHSDSSGPELVGGEFDKDESPGTVANARKSKARSLASVKAKEGLPENPVLKSLVPADVNDIDTKEAQATPLTKTAKPRKTVTFADLPFPPDDIKFYRQKMGQAFVPQMIYLGESQEAQFGFPNAQPEVLELISTQWKKTFPELKGNSKDANIVQYLRSETRQYRSDIGKEALKIVERKVEEVGETIKERSEWVKRELENNRFIYSNPGMTASESTGAMRGPGVIETFSYHLRTATAGIERKHDTDFKFPAGAVALSAAAYERALKIFEPGYNSAQKLRTEAKEKRLSIGNTTPLPKNSTAAFSDALWANTVRKYARILKDANWSKWRQFYDAAKEYLPAESSSPEFEEMDLDDGVPIILSSEA
ncbi:hypothetical protein AAF712_014427 [Marasmius tenuissimus]|uniref:DUF6532 domain-containing protein n=1 Tax=Marasmius tenuissimus TaxID=585030 RepID=A0ABR2ZB36_9AGAR